MWVLSLDVNGWLAGFCTSAALWPLVRKLAELQTANEISWWNYGASNPGSALWGLYALQHHSQPLFWTQVPTVALTTIIIIQKVKYGGSRLVGGGAIALTVLLPLSLALLSAPVELTGSVAGVLTTFSLLPQVGRVTNLGSAREIAPRYLALFGIGVMLWGIYSVRIDGPAQMWTQIFTETLVIALATLRMMYGTRSRGYALFPALAGDTAST